MVLGEQKVWLCGFPLFQSCAKSFQGQKVPSMEELWIHRDTPLWMSPKAKVQRNTLYFGREFWQLSKTM